MGWSGGGGKGVDGAEGLMGPFETRAALTFLSRWCRNTTHQHSIVRVYDRPFTRGLSYNASPQSFCHYSCGTLLVRVILAQQHLGTLLPLHSRAYRWATHPRENNTQQRREPGTGWYLHTL